MRELYAIIPSKVPKKYSIRVIDTIEPEGSKYRDTIWKEGLSYAEAQEEVKLLKIIQEGLTKVRL